MNIGVLILTSLWRPVAGESSQLLLYTATWGVVDGTLQSQVQGTYRIPSLAFGRVTPKLRFRAGSHPRLAFGQRHIQASLLARVTPSLAFGQGHIQASHSGRVTSKPRFRAGSHPSLALRQSHIQASLSGRVTSKLRFRAPWHQTRS